MIVDAAIPARASGMANVLSWWLAWSRNDRFALRVGACLGI